MINMAIHSILKYHSFYDYETLIHASQVYKNNKWTDMTIHINKARKKLTETDRKVIASKTNNRCAYCGKTLEDGFHIDHIISINKKGTNEMDNLFASCISCNLSKSSYSIEEFRQSIKDTLKIIKRDYKQYNKLLRFGLVKEIDKDVVFYFETLKEVNND